MMSMLDYIKWRGDLSFEERELNEIDSLIFSYLSYEMFDGLDNYLALLDKYSIVDSVFSKFFFKFFT